MNTRTLTATGSVLSALASSACCWLPLVLLGVGLSAAGVSGFFESYRFYFLASAVVLLGVGFYLNYFRARACGPDGSCEPDAARQRLERGMLWLSALLVVAFSLLPAGIGPVLGAQTAPASGTAVVTESLTVGIEGMTCGGCEGAVTEALVAVPGVLEVRASYADSNASLVIDMASPPPHTALGAAVAKAGYTMVGADSASAHTVRRLAGQWKASIQASETESVELTLNLGQLGTRWVGEFDLSGTRIENYPVVVKAADDAVELYFSGIGTDFKGKLSEAGQRLSGLARSPRDTKDWKLIFERTGEPQFSELFLKLEAVAEDSDAVRSLGGKARELKATFNEDTDKVRLLLLLSPS